MHRLPYLLILLTLLGCESSAGRFRLSGHFDHLEQGEFLIYSHDGGMERLDTLFLKGGKFEYTIPLNGHATFSILYPNYSELVIFGQEGEKATIKGDARSLNEVTVKGTEDNEIYTRFRRESTSLSSIQTDSLARNYILRYPTLAVSRYLLKKYFILPPKDNGDMLWEMYDSLRRANPGDVALLNLSEDIRTKNVLTVGERIPEFSLPTRQVTLARYKNGKKHERTIDAAIVADTTHQDKPMLLAFWATWKNGSASALFRTRKLLNAHPDSIVAVSYSLDVEETEIAAVEQRDSIDYPSYCDYRCWDSPLVQKWGIRELPYFILINRDRKIVAKGTNWVEDIEPYTKDICL